MKTNKPKMQKKVAKKAGKKELAKTLADRFLQVLNEFEQEAEKMGADLNKVGLSAIKKLSSKLSGEKSVKKTAARDAKEAKKAIVENKKPAKKADAGKVKGTKEVPVQKNDKEVNHTLRNTLPKARPAAQSVKVVPILTEENAARAIAKKAPVKKTTRTPKTQKSDNDVKS